MTIVKGLLIFRVKWHDSCIMEKSDGVLGDEGSIIMEGGLVAEVLEGRRVRFGERGVRFLQTDNIWSVGHGKVLKRGCEGEMLVNIP